MNTRSSLTGETEPAGASALSALVDGELLPHEIDEVLASLAESDPDHARWNSYQVIGDVLRQSAPAVAARSPQAFLAGIRAELQASTPERPALPEKTLPPASPMGQGRVVAANDAVFRWKLVAGLASLAAVMAVSWTQLQTTAPQTDGPGAGAVLAQREMPFSLASVDPGASPSGAAALPDTVVVQTPQGPVLRDPQLEALMDQHRQHGGMTALQMPTGFLRNATYDAPKR